MKNIILFLTLLISFGCKKENSCETWEVTYWQGKGDHTTVTTNYYPSNKNEIICGAGKDTVIANKAIIVSQAGPDLYNYKTFIAKK